MIIPSWLALVTVGLVGTLLSNVLLDRERRRPLHLGISIRSAVLVALSGSLGAGLIFLAQGWRDGWAIAREAVAMGMGFGVGVLLGSCLIIASARLSRRG